LPLSYWNATGVWYGNSEAGTRFFRRNSATSMPMALAVRSHIRSRRYVASSRPAPRYASTGVVFVREPITSQ
jgi:hypothetical protein